MFYVIKQVNDAYMWAAISPKDYAKKQLNLKWKKLEKKHMKQFPPGQSTLCALKRIESKYKASRK